MDKLVNIPILPMRMQVIFPNTTIAIDVERKSTQAVLKHASETKSRVIAVLQKDAHDDTVEEEGVREVGVLCDVSKIVQVNDNHSRVYLDGLATVDIVSVKDLGKFLMADAYEREFDTMDAERLNIYRQKVIEALSALESADKLHVPKYLRKSVISVETPQLLVNISSGFLDNYEEKYRLLINKSSEEQLQDLLVILKNMLKRAEWIRNIDKQVEEKLAKNNKDFVLREQMKAINKELNDDNESYLAKYRQQIQELIATNSVKEKLTTEVDRLSRMGDSSGEAAIIRNYLDVVLSLPWDNLTPDEKDLVKVRKVLDEDHYGIDDVKERVVEYLAVRQLAGAASEGTTICLVGPPGVGKTSVAKSIAMALNKEYVQLTLGGVHDEAEIRGHRKTYIGAMPGRIVSSLAGAKTNNPLFLLDEVDKLTKDMRGDPQSALLEVLDKNQNKIFRDNYIELPYDLSQVMFMLTANDISQLDKPLLDRLEVIEMSGYTVEEKIAIAEKYLIKKQSAANGIVDYKISIPKAVLREIIEDYTSESGVRDLERKIATVARKIAYKIVTGKIEDKKIAIKSQDLREYLGVKQYHLKSASLKGEVGKVTGLAWTAVGGVTMDMEALVLSGTGQLKLTGSLGNVMKESAQIALSLATKLTADKNINKEFMDNHDIHVHVPMGAVPKDGPSAGITLTCAIYSALTNKKLKDNIAMTGEVSLSGRVLPIGGLKEKTLAAQRAGVKTVLIPQDNEGDLDKVPQSVKDALNIIKVSRIEEVLQNAIESEQLSI